MLNCDPSQAGGSEVLCMKEFWSMIMHEKQALQALQGGFRIKAVTLSDRDV